MSDDVTIPRETAVRMAARLRALVPWLAQGNPDDAAAALADADVLDPPGPPLTLAQEATVERLAAAGYDRAKVRTELRDGGWGAYLWPATHVLDFAARDPLRLLAEHGTPLTEEPPEGTLLLVVRTDGGAPLVPSRYWAWDELSKVGTVYRLGGAS